VRSRSLFRCRASSQGTAGEAAWPAGRSQQGERSTGLPAGVGTLLLPARTGCRRALPGPASRAAPSASPRAPVPAAPPAAGAVWGDNPSRAQSPAAPAEAPHRGRARPPPQRGPGWPGSPQEGLSTRAPRHCIQHWGLGPGHVPRSPHCPPGSANAPGQEEQGEAVQEPAGLWGHDGLLEPPCLPGRLRCPPRPRTRRAARSSLRLPTSDSGLAGTSVP